MKRRLSILTKFSIKRCSILLLASCVAFALQSPNIQALTAEDLQGVQGDWAYFDPTAGSCATNASVSTEGISSEREDIIRTIIGIARTYDLGKRGALIGLMAAITESRIQNYANSNIPESQTNPAWKELPEPRPIGNDSDSVGIMQQRPSTSWSTYGTYTSGTSAKTKKNIVWQLMDPAYAAQAFFGTPPGADLPNDLANPGALKKGLQNLGDSADDWKRMDPGEAAQSVQISAYPSRYSDNQDVAQSYVDKYWDDSPAVELPISVTGGEGSSSTAYASYADCTSTASGEFRQIILDYAWPDYKGAGHIELMPLYEKAVKEAQSRGEYVGGTNYVGVDCGGFVTRVMRNSGLDPNYNEDEANVENGQYPYIKKNLGKKYKRVSDILGREVRSTADLQPGDIWINEGQSHTYMYVGKIEGFNGNSAEASLDTRAPMATAAWALNTWPDKGEYTEWFRLIDSSQEEADV